MPLLTATKPLAVADFGPLLCILAIGFLIRRWVKHRRHCIEVGESFFRARAQPYQLWEQHFGTCNSALPYVLDNLTKEEQVLEQDIAKVEQELKDLSATQVFVP